MCKLRRIVNEIHAISLEFKQKKKEELYETITHASFVCNQQKQPALNLNIPA